MTTLLEFAVEMTCGGCEAAIRTALETNQNIKIRQLSHTQDKLVVETHLPSHQVQALVESTGKKAVLKGLGGMEKTTDFLAGGDGPNIIPKSHVGAAVAMMYPSKYFGPVDQNVQGVTRFIQVDAGTCVVEGTIDGLSPGHHNLHVHECGDLSQGCDSTGDIFNPYGSPHGGPDDFRRHVGDLGKVLADQTGRASFRITDNILKVSDIIGRSLVVKEGSDDLGQGDGPESKSTERGIACGVIARSAGLFDNPKTICACDGKTLWDERGDATRGKKQSA